METHEHHHQVENQDESWFKRHRWITYIGLGVLGYFLLVEHREHVLPFLPYLFLSACLFMHSFMHGGHKHDDHSHGQQEEKKL
jgi:hypothetical protein